MILYTIILFVILTPSVIFQLPKKGNKYTVAFVHGLIFAVVFHFTHKMATLNEKENMSGPLYSDSSCKNMVKNKAGAGKRYKLLKFQNGPGVCKPVN